MADRLEVFDITVPANTAKANAQSFPLVFDPGHLIRYEVVIPDGPAGLAGFAFTYAGQQVIPNTIGAFIIGNDERIADDVRYDFVGQQWRLLAYNTDVFTHTFHLRLFVDEIGTQVSPGEAVPEVLPVTINAGTIDLTGGGDTLLDLGEPPPPTFADTVTPLDIPPDAVSIDTGTDVTPLDLPPDAPVLIDTPTVTDTPDVTE